VTGCRYGACAAFCGSNAEPLRQFRNKANRSVADFKMRSARPGLIKASASMRHFLNQVPGHRSTVRPSRAWLRGLMSRCSRAGPQVGAYGLGSVTTQRDVPFRLSTTRKHRTPISASRCAADYVVAETADSQATLARQPAHHGSKACGDTTRRGLPPVEAITLQYRQRRRCSIAMSK
jgi:hypothetical protein